MKIQIPKVYQAVIYPIIKAVVEDKPFPIKKITAKGSRGSAKTYTLGVVLSATVGLIAKTKIHAFRYIKSDLKETLIEDYQNFFNTHNIPYTYNVTNGTIEFGKESIIRFFGLKKSRSDKMNLTGLASALGFDYGFNFKDEIVEYDEEESQQVNEALRGFKLGRLLEIRTYNPADATHWANEHLLKYLPENIEKIMKQNYDCNITHTIENDCVEAFYQTNYKCNPFIDPELRRELDTLPLRDPVRARTMTYGLDGIGANALFVLVDFQWVTTQNIKDWRADAVKTGVINTFMVGFDYGKRDVSVMTLSYVHAKLGIVLCETYGYDRRKDKMMSDTTLSYIFAMELDRWMNKYAITKMDFVYDYDNATFPEIMKQKSAWPNYINLLKAKKHPIYERVIFLRQLLGIKKIYVNKDNMQNSKVINQIRNAKGTYNSANVLSRFDGNDDYYNAFEYSWCYCHKDFFSYLFKK